MILVLGWPLNSFIAKRSIRIQKGVMAARDKRMGVLNELIAAVCYLSEHSWSDIDLHLTKDQIHQVLCMGGSLDRPCIRRARRRDQVDDQRVSITSFLVFVLQGNELTVSIAFTVRPLTSDYPKN